MNKKTKQQQRRARTRRNLHGTHAMPRLSVFRSNKNIYVQLIDDEQGVTLMGVSQKNVTEGGKRVEKAKALGILVAKKAGEINIKKVVFDRGSYGYHGIVKAIAEGVREGGLQV